MVIIIKLKALIKIITLDLIYIHCFKTDLFHWLVLIIFIQYFLEFAKVKNPMLEWHLFYCQE